MKAAGGGVRPSQASLAGAPVAGVFCTLALPWLLLCCPAGTRAAQREWRASVGTQANPLSLQFRGSLGWKWRLFDSASPLLRDAAVSAGFSEALTPAYSRTEAWVQIAPLAVFDVRAGAELVGYFGSFGHLVGLPSYDSDFSDDAREALRDDARGAVGGVLSVTPTLKLALGRLAFRSSASFEWWLVDAPPVYYYEPYRGTLLDPGGDSLLALTSLALFDVSGDGSRRRQIGLYHDLLYVWSAPQNRRQRLGPFASWSLGDRRLGLAEPVLLVGILPYLEAPNRDGVSAIVAVSFRLDRKR